MRPLRDIRYFESDQVPTTFPVYASKLVKLPKEAISFGQRVGRKCEELRLCIGHETHLYICYTRGLRHGEVQLTDLSFMPWCKFVLVGAHAKLNELSVKQKLFFVRDTTFQALKLLAPSFSAQFDLVQHAIEKFGEALLVCIKSKETKRYSVLVEQTIPTHPQKSKVFACITDLRTFETRETLLTEVAFHDDALTLVNRIAVTDTQVIFYPRTSHCAGLVTIQHQTPFKVAVKNLFDSEN